MTMPVEQNGKKIKIYSLVAIAVSVLAVILRTCCLLWFYDEDIGYYSRGFLPILLDAVCILAVAFFVSLLFVVKPCDKAGDGKEDNLAVKISSAAAAVAFALFFVSSVLSTSLVTGNVVFDLTSKISALSAIVYFCMNLFASRANRVVQTALGFFIIIWNICTLGITYFDVYVQLNSPDKTILHLALVACMAFFVSEFRCFVDGVKSKSYLFFASCAILLSGTSSVPSLVAYMFGRSVGEKYIFYNVVLFALFAYCAARLVSFVFARKSEEDLVTEDSEES